MKTYGEEYGFTVSVAEPVASRDGDKFSSTSVRDALRDEKFVVTVDPEIADRARGAIERMVAIG